MLHALTMLLLAGLTYSVVWRGQVIREWVESAIDDAVRRQDDRIRQQVVRAKANIVPTESDEPPQATNRIGEPYIG